MYTQYFFKFPSQDAMRTALSDESVGWWGEVGVADGEPVYAFTLDGHSGALDEVGTIINDPGVYDIVTGEEVAPPTYVDGWHLNAVLNTPLPEPLEEYLVTPTPVTPSRVFAGFEVV
jgi:hypothetical protein